MELSHLALGISVLFNVVMLVCVIVADRRAIMRERMISRLNEQVRRRDRFLEELREIEKDILMENSDDELL